MFNVILPKFNPFTKNACNECTDFCIGGSIALLSPVQIVIMLVRRTPLLSPFKRDHRPLFKQTRFSTTPDNYRPADNLKYEYLATLKTL